MIEQETQTREETTISAPTTQQVVSKVRTVDSPVTASNPQQVYQTKKAIFRTYQVIWYILGIIEVVLASRVFLKLLGAYSGSGFTAFIYALSNPFALPFAGILRTSQTSSSVIEWSALIAMIVYAVVAYGIVELLQLIKPTNRAEVESNVDNV